MSKRNKRKHVFQEFLDYDLSLNDNQEIGKVESGRGNNLHEVCLANGEKILASMPTRYRRNIWIKRGDYVVLEKITEGIKVQAEIVRILTKEQINELKKEGKWPYELSQEVNTGSDADALCTDLVKNENRKYMNNIVSGQSENSGDSD